MTIKMIFGNEGLDHPSYSRIYRNVVKNTSLAQYTEGFYAQRENYRWGALIQLKGKQRIILRTFGKLPNGETLTGEIAKHYVSA